MRDEWLSNCRKMTSRSPRLIHFYFILNSKNNTKLSLQVSIYFKTDTPTCTMQMQLHKPTLLVSPNIIKKYINFKLILLYSIIICKKTFILLLCYKFKQELKNKNMIIFLDQGLCHTPPAGVLRPLHSRGVVQIN